MATISSDRLDRLLLDAEAWRKELAAGGYSLAVNLLNIMILEIRMKRHGISDDELNALCLALEDMATNQSALKKARLTVVKS